MYTPMRSPLWRGRLRCVSMALCIAFACSHSLYAEGKVSATLDLIVSQADLVVVADVVDVGGYGPEETPDIQFTFKIVEVLKASFNYADSVKLAGQKLVAGVRGWGRDPREMLKPGRAFLCCLASTERFWEDQEPPFAAEAWGRMTPGRDTLLPLDGSAHPGALMPDFTYLTQGQAIVEAARAAAKADAERRSASGDKPPEVVRVSAPAPSPCSICSCAGHTLTVDMPVDDQLEGRAMEWVRSEDYGLRTDAVRVLGRYRSARNTALLKDLLDDPAYATCPKTQDSPEKRVYGVRAAAFEVLKAWGVEVQPPLTEECVEDSAP
jgi:hypothetical protein